MDLSRTYYWYWKYGYSYCFSIMSSINSKKALSMNRYNKFIKFNCFIQLGLMPIPCAYLSVWYSCSQQDELGFKLQTSVSLSQCSNLWDNLLPWNMKSFGHVTSCRLFLFFFCFFQSFSYAICQLSFIHAKRILLQISLFKKTKKNLTKNSKKRWREKK